MILRVMYTCPPYPSHKGTKGGQNFGETDSNKLNVRFGSLAEICSAKGHVRFTPNSDRESEFPQTVMSALLPKADMCGAARDVR
jgi:hypothetical protein